MNKTIALGALEGGQRSRVAGILRSSRLFREDEVDVALELFDESVGKPPSGGERDYTFLGAYGVDGELSGFACYGPTPDCDGTYDLYWIAVDATVQGRGSGTALLGEVEKRLGESGARLVIVETSSRPDYDGTRSFYLRRGYREAARVADYYGPLDGRVIFTKRLLPGIRSRFKAHGVMSQ